MNDAKTLGLALSIGAALALPLITSCVPSECIDDVEPGDELVVRLVDDYGPELTRFRWHSIYGGGGTLLPSCGEVGDVSAPSEIQVGVTHSVRVDGGCSAWAGRALDIPGVESIDPGVRLEVGASLSAHGTHTGACESEWALAVVSPVDRRDLLGLPAIEGEVPPVIVYRKMIGPCVPGGHCMDFFAGEIGRD